MSLLLSRGFSVQCLMVTLLAVALWEADAGMNTLSLASSASPARINQARMLWADAWVDDAVDQQKCNRSLGPFCEAPEQIALEEYAVHLSLVLQRSCTESGQRQCWRSALQQSHSEGEAAPKALRPITVTFGESRDSRIARSAPVPVRAPLVTSLREFRQFSLPAQ